MPIKDLLWACPLCHQIESIDTAGRCGACHARFTRGRGARIRALTRDGSEEQHPLDWLAQLPWPDLDGDGRALPAGLRPPFTQPVEVRLGVAEVPLRKAGAFLGIVEKFGPSHAGQLELAEASLSFTPGVEGRPKGWSWPLTEITAIQPSSSSIQLKARGRQVVSMRFPAGSLRLWEQRLQYCVRAAYEREGKGNVVEFQPHIRLS
jgi:hypothetical protein